MQSAVQPNMALPLKTTPRNQLDPHIIKQLYYVAFIKGCKLPSGFATLTHHTKVGVRGDGCTAIDTRSHAIDTVLPVVLRTDNPIPVYCSVYYFEVTVNVKSRAGPLAIGVCSSRSSLHEWPGMEINSYGYHSNNGVFYHAAKELPTTGPPFGESDVIGCGVNFVTNSVFFTKNGVFMGPISTGKKLPHPVYPCVALACPNCHVSANFGQHQFTFDIGQYIARERAVVISMALDRKCNEQLAHVTMRNLVAAYMLHNGYLESAQALGGWISKANPNPNAGLTQDTNTQCPLDCESVKEPPDPDSARTPMSDTYSLNSPDSVAVCKSVIDGKPAEHNETKPNGLQDLFQWPEAIDLLLKRRQLRDTIRKGDYLSALEQLETHFRSLSEQDPSISFVLRCHHFIDLICNQQKHAVASNSTSVISPTTPNPTHCNSSQPLLHAEPLRMAQKRPNPSSSLESSPDTARNGSCVTPIPADYLTLDSSSSAPSVCTNSTATVQQHQQSSCTHEHSPSSCQAPIRLCLDASETGSNMSNNNNFTIGDSGSNSNGDENGSSAKSHSASVPIYPSNHVCYRESQGCRPMNALSLAANESQSEVARSDNGHTAHDPDELEESSKKEHRLVTTLRLGGAAECDRLGPSVGLLESLPEQHNSLGNGVARFKCVNIIRRGKLTTTTTEKLIQSPCPTGATERTQSPVDRTSTGSASPAPQSHDHSPDSNCDHAVNGLSTEGPVLNGCWTNQNGYAEPTENGHSHPDTNDKPVRTCSMNDNIKQSLKPICLANSLPSTNEPGDEVLNVVEYGRMLGTAATELRQRNAISPSQMQLLNGAFGLIAYQDPYASPFRRFLDPSHRDRLADAVNSAIMVHLNQPANPILDSALAFLERSLTEDDSTLAGTIRGAYLGSSTESPNERPHSGVDRAIYSAPAQSEFAPGMSEAAQSRGGPLDSTNPHRLTSYSDRLSSPESPINAAPTPFSHWRLRSVLSNWADSSSVEAHGPSTEADPTQGNSPHPNNNNNTSGSASIVASSLYIPPSALVSLSSRPRQTEPGARQTTCTLLTATAALQATSRMLSSNWRHALESPRLTQRRGRYSTSSSPPRAHTGSALTSNVAGWSSIPSDSLPAPELSRSQQQHPVPSAAVRLAVASYLTDTHAPTGPELAGFFHPLLFID